MRSRVPAWYWKCPCAYRDIGHAVQIRRPRTVAHCTPTPPCRARIRLRRLRRTSSHHRQVGRAMLRASLACKRCDAACRGFERRVLTLLPLSTLKPWTVRWLVRSLRKRASRPEQSGHHVGAFAPRHARSRLGRLSLRLSGSHFFPLPLSRYPEDSRFPFVPIQTSHLGTISLVGAAIETPSAWPAEPGGMAARRTQTAQLALENGAPPMQAACVVRHGTCRAMSHICGMPCVMQPDIFHAYASAFACALQHTHARMAACPRPCPDAHTARLGPTCEYSEYPV